VITRKSKALFASAAIFTLMGVAGIVADAAYKTVTVQDNGTKEVFHSFSFGTVNDFLKKQGIAYTRNSRISPSPAVSLANGMAITVEDPRQITIVDGDHATTCQTFAKTVAAALKEQNIALASTDELNVPLAAPVSDGEKIQIEHIQKQVSVQHEEIPFQTVRRQSASLYKGQTRIVTHGVKGKKDITSRTVLVDGMVVAHSVSQQVVKRPVAKVIEVGTQLRPIHLASRSFSPLTGNTEQVRVEVTAYAAGGGTATGARAVPGIAAVDPAVIPYGSHILIPGFGTVVAEDTGGAIQGNHIDICLANRAQATQWGVRWLTVTIAK